MSDNQTTFLAQDEEDWDEEILENDGPDCVEPHPLHSDDAKFRCDYLLNRVHLSVRNALKKRRQAWIINFGIAAFVCHLIVFAPEHQWTLKKAIFGGVFIAFAFVAALHSVTSATWGEKEAEEGYPGFVTWKGFLHREIEGLFWQCHEADMRRIETLMEIVPKERAARYVREEILRQLP